MKKKAKQTLIMSIAIIISLMVFAACGNSGSTGDVEKILDYDESYTASETKEVLYLKGSWSEIGFQYAMQAPDAVKITLACGVGDAIDEFGSFENAVKEAKQYSNYAEEKAPMLIELWEGMATALGVDYDVVMVGSVSYTVPSKNCSTIAAWGEATEDGRLLVGANHDTNYYENVNLPAVVVYPDEGNAFISSCGFTSNCLMNEKGLVITGSSGQAGLKGDRGAGLPTMTALIPLAATCDTVEDARKAVFEGVCTGSGDNIHISDIEHNDLIIEHTAQKNTVRKSGDFGEKDYTIATNNFLTKEMEDSLYKGEEYWDDCMPRYWTEEKILQDSFGKITLDTLNDALGCDRYYVDPDWYDFVWGGENFVGYKAIENGQWSDVWDLSDTCTGFWSPENKEPGTKCLQRAIADPENGTMYLMKGGKNTLSSINPNATGNFVRITFAEKPENMNNTAKTEAQKQIFRAGRDLDDAVNDKKEKYLNKAKQALLSGDNFTYKAMCLTGTEQTSYFGKATTQYCKAQAYAQLAQDDPTKIIRDGEDYMIW